MKNFNSTYPQSKLHFIKRASMADFEYISEWMTDAFQNELEGYTLYHNLNGFILDAFKEHTVFVLRHNGKAVAFLTYSPPSDDSITIVFRIVCVKPDYLRRGLATLIHKQAIEHFKRKGCKVAELWNVCYASHKLGESMGFSECMNLSGGSICSMYKVLEDCRKQNFTAKRRFVVWDGYDTKVKPIYSWSLNFRSNKKPIIHFTWYDWMVGIVENDKVIYQDKAKYFFDILPLGGEYIYINEEKSKSIVASLKKYDL